MHTIWSLALGALGPRMHSHVSINVPDVERPFCPAWESQRMESLLYMPPPPLWLHFWQVDKKARRTAKKKNSKMLLPIRSIKLPCLLAGLISNVDLRICGDDIMPKYIPVTCRHLPRSKRSQTQLECKHS